MYVPLGLSQPLSRQRVWSSPQNGGGGAHSPAGEGLGESQCRRHEKKLSTLPTLWVIISLLGKNKITSFKFQVTFTKKVCALEEYAMENYKRDRKNFPISTILRKSKILKILN